MDPLFYFICFSLDRSSYRIIVYYNIFYASNNFINDIFFLFYRLVFGISYFTQLHGCAIFLALGIGADDIFVYSDAWIQNKNEEDLSKRIEKTLDRTVLAVFNTSFTTAIAFLATAVSPAMPISSFGIYAALTIITNYLFVLTFTPNVILIKDKYINKWCSCKKK